jgi:hypothetical protein
MQTPRQIRDDSHLGRAILTVLCHYPISRAPDGTLRRDDGLHWLPGQQMYVDNTGLVVLSPPRSIALRHELPHLDRITREMLILHELTDARGNLSPLDPRW